MNHGPLAILELRAQIGELGAAIRQLRAAGMRSATAQLLMARKRAELDRLMKTPFTQPGEGLQ